MSFQPKQGLRGTFWLQPRDGRKLFDGDDNDVLNGGTGADKLYGGDGTDRAQYSNASTGVRADLLNSNTNTGEALGDTYFSIEHLWGSAHADTLLGTDSSDKVWGSGSNDTLYGRGGNDTLHGDAGNDMIYGGSGSDYMSGGAGNDTVYFASDDAQSMMVDGIHTQRMLGGSGRDKLILEAGAVFDTSNLGWYQFEEFQGANLADHVTTTNDSVDHELSGGGGADVLNAAGGDDTLNGDAGNDRLYGRAGNDILVGGSGNDTMTGGSGNDTFDFQANHGTDVITDFQDNVDKIDLSSLGVTWAGKGTSWSITSNGGNAKIIYDGTDNVTLTRIASSALTESDFVF